MIYNLLEMDLNSLWLGMSSINKNSFLWINEAPLNINRWDAGKPTSVKKEACMAVT